MPNRLQQLHDAGQSIWLDYIDRSMLADGDLARRIRDEALTGMTSNPTIFEKALAEGEAYDEQLAAAKAGLGPWELFELVEVMDVQTACDQFRPVYDATDAGDGYVSIEVSPGVANDPDATIEEGRRLWQAVDRPNAMIKVPGTESGARAVRTLLADGVNVNVTLLFSVDAHRRVMEAYLDALEQRAAAGQPVDRVASVASFFVSRVDNEVDKRLDALAAGLPEDRRAHALALRGKAAIANAKMAYRAFQETFAGPRWEALAAAARWCSARSGRARAPRTRPTATCSTSSSSSGRTPSTRCRRPRSTPSATTARPPARSTPTWPPPSARWPTSRR
jgi:transaldolase